MKQITAILRDGSRMCYKIVPDDFDVEAWTEKRKYNFGMLGILKITVETLPQKTKSLIDVGVLDIMIPIVVRRNLDL